MSNYLSASMASKCLKVSKSTLRNWKKKNLIKTKEKIVNKQTWFLYDVESVKPVFIEQPVKASEPVKKTRPKKMKKNTDKNHTYVKFSKACEMLCVTPYKLHVLISRGQYKTKTEDKKIMVDLKSYIDEWEAIGTPCPQVYNKLERVEYFCQRLGLTRTQFYDYVKQGLIKKYTYKNAPTPLKRYILVEDINNLKDGKQTCERQQFFKNINRMKELNRISLDYLNRLYPNLSFGRERKSVYKCIASTESIIDKLISSSL